MKNNDSLLNGFWKFHSKSLFLFPGPDHSICRAKSKYNLGIFIGFQELIFQFSIGFLLRCSEIWGKKNDPNAQFQIQLIGFISIAYSMNFQISSKNNIKTYDNQIYPAIIFSHIIYLRYNKTKYRLIITDLLIKNNPHLIITNHIILYSHYCINNPL